MKILRICDQCACEFMAEYEVRYCSQHCAKRSAEVQGAIDEFFSYGIHGQARPLDDGFFRCEKCGFKLSAIAKFRDGAESNKCICIGCARKI